MSDTTTKVARKNGFPVRYFQSADGRYIEAWLIKTGPGYNSYRWRMCYAKINSGFAFGKLGTSVTANNALTDAAKLFGLTEIQELPAFSEMYVTTPTTLLSSSLKKVGKCQMCGVDTSAIFVFKRQELCVDCFDKERSNES